MSNAKIVPNLRMQSSRAQQPPPADETISSWNHCATISASNGGKTIPLHREVSAGLPSLRLNRVIAFVDDNIAVNLCVSTLAAVAGMSPYYFCRSFKQSTGTTPHRYVLERRMEQAKRLLEQSSEPLVGIAHQVGFADQSQFTRVFHKIVGSTPTEFRKDCHNRRNCQNCQKLKIRCTRVIG